MARSRSQGTGSDFTIPAGGRPDSSDDLQRILDSVLDGIVVVGADGLVEEINDEASRILETSSDHARRRPMAELVGESSPIAMLVADVQESRLVPKKGNERELDIHDWVNVPRSDVPAITHVDYSARIQSVSQETNPRYHSLIKAFEDLNGYGIIINTSCNVRGEPIICTPEDAYRCFMRTEMDYLTIGPFLLAKTEQPHWEERERWQEVFKLD